MPWTPLTMLKRASPLLLQIILLCPSNGWFPCASQKIDWCHEMKFSSSFLALSLSKFDFSHEFPCKISPILSVHHSLLILPERWGALLSPCYLPNMCRLFLQSGDTSVVEVAPSFSSKKWTDYVIFFVFMTDACHFKQITSLNLPSVAHLM